MAVTDWWELRGGFIVGDVIKWRDPVWAARDPKDRKKGSTSFGGQQMRCVGRRVISAEVISEPDEDGWVYLLVMQHDNVGAAPLDKIFAAPPVGKKVRRKVKTIMNGEPMRLPWDNESARERLLSEVWQERDEKYWLGNDEYEGENA